MITNKGGRIMFHVCKDPTDAEYDLMSDVQKDICVTWRAMDGYLFSVTQIARRNCCSRGQAQKAIRKLEKLRIVLRYCGGYKTRWNAILCDECGRQFEDIDLRFFVRAMFAPVKNYFSPPFKSRHLRLTNDRNRTEGEEYNYRKHRGWIYEARVCSDCLSAKVFKYHAALDKLKITSVILGMTKFEETNG